MTSLGDLEQFGQEHQQRQPLVFSPNLVLREVRKLEKARKIRSYRPSKKKIGKRPRPTIEKAPDSIIFYLIFS